MRKIKIYILLFIMTTFTFAYNLKESVLIDISDKSSISVKATFNVAKLSHKGVPTIYIPMETNIGMSNLIITEYKVNNKEMPLLSGEIIKDNKSTLYINPATNSKFQNMNTLYIEYEIPYPPIEKRRSSDTLQISIPYVSYNGEKEYRIEFPLSLEYEKCSVFIKNGLNLIKAINKDIGESTLVFSLNKIPVTQIDIVTPPKTLNYNSNSINIRHSFTLPSPLIPSLIFVSVIFLIMREKSDRITESYTKDTPSSEDILLHCLIWNGKIDRDTLPTALLESAKEGNLKIYNDYSHTIPFVRLTKKETNFNTEEMQYLHEEILFDKSDTFIFSVESAKKVDNKIKVLENILLNRALREGYFTAEPKTIHKKITLYIALPLMTLTGYILYFSYLKYGSDVTLWLNTYILGYFLVAYITVKDIKIKNLEQWWQKLLLLLFPFLVFPAPENMNYIENMFIPVFIPIFIIFILTVYIYRHFIPLSEKGKKIYTMLKQYRSRINPADKNFIPTYTKKLDSILPYISLFDLSNRWKKYLGDRDIYISWFEGDKWDFIKNAWRSINRISLFESDDE